jgi:isochorismate synthase/2-succinyl-5-enolpyruvyl-6-hydroxy-3-cyclohexene-1-carboxylate synthase/2-succinyl-6-hydroxy-2,4-cyclohexadiene-1-carboxylate synthase/O-succinylbenzoate synthase
VPAVVLTSSGTAVANLLPAVVEASQAGVPLLLLTAMPAASAVDMPGGLPCVLRCSRPAYGSHIPSEHALCSQQHYATARPAQVKIFGGYTRFAADLAPPTGDAPARVLLTTLDAAVGAATDPASPGPAHVNCQFREPLGPAVVPWSQGLLQVGCCFGQLC